MSKPSTFELEAHADVLFVTVNEFETQALLETFEHATERKATQVPIGDRLYRDLGTVNGTRCFHALSEMGSSGPGATQQTVEKGIRAVKPAAVIAVGIAFGMNERKQDIGDILLSKQLRLYDLQRVGGEIVLRGDRPHASTWLVNYFEGIAQTSWTGVPVRSGVILSGEKLVDNLDYRQQLARFEPEAVGGEMEGAGLYVASYDSKVDWIVVKAICDWADGKKAKNKKARQQKAARNAVQFVMFALQQAPLRLHQPVVATERLVIPGLPPPRQQATRDERRVYYEGFDGSGGGEPEGRALNDFWLIGPMNVWEGRVTGGAHYLCNRLAPDAVIHNNIRYYERDDVPIDLGDCRVSVRVKVGPPNDSHSGAGLRFRADPNGENYYAFMLNAGRAVTVAHVAAGRMQFLWSRELAGVTTEPFVTLSVTGRGPELDFSVNGVVVHAMKSAGLLHGNTGIIALSLGDFGFDDFALYMPTRG